jgi:hypothetical protein
MLRRRIQRSCVECGRAWGDPGFVCYSGKTAGGPAYWSDDGLICSPACMLAHAKKREQEGRPMTAPAQDPMDV